MGENRLSRGRWQPKFTCGTCNTLPHVLATKAFVNTSNRIDACYRPFGQFYAVRAPRWRCAADVVRHALPFTGTRLFFRANLDIFWFANWALRPVR